MYEECCEVRKEGLAEALLVTEGLLERIMLEGVEEEVIKRRPQKRGVKSGEDWVIAEGIAEDVAEGVVVVEDGLVTEEAPSRRARRVPSLLPVRGYAVIATVVLTTPTTREKGLLRRQMTMRTKAIGRRRVGGCRAWPRRGGRREIRRGRGRQGRRWSWQSWRRRRRRRRRRRGGGGGRACRQ